MSAATDHRAFTGTSAPRVGVVGAGGLGVHHVRILRDLAGDRVRRIRRREPGARGGSGRAARGARAAVAGRAAGRCRCRVGRRAHDGAPSRSHRPRCGPGSTSSSRSRSPSRSTRPTTSSRRRGRRAWCCRWGMWSDSIARCAPPCRTSTAPRFIESDRLAPFNPRGSDVAVVLDLMIHDLDLVHTLVGARVADVQAMGIPVLTPQLDIANARLTFANGAVANITASRVSRERVRKLRIFQQSGYLSLDLAAGTGEFFRHPSRLRSAAAGARAARARGVRRAGRARRARMASRSRSSSRSSSARSWARARSP